MVLSNGRCLTNLITNTEQFHEGPSRILSGRFLGPLAALHVQLVNKLQLICTRIRLTFTIEEPAAIRVDFAIVDIVRRVDEPKTTKIGIYNAFLHQLGTNKELMFVKDRNVWALNVNTVLNNILFVITIALWSQRHEEAESTRGLRHFKIGGKNTTICLQETLNLVILEVMVQRRVAVKMKVQINQDRYTAISYRSFYETEWLLATYEEMVVEFIQECLVLTVIYTPVAFLTAHACKCCRLAIFLVCHVCM